MASTSKPETKSGNSPETSLLYPYPANLNPEAVRIAARAFVGDLTIETGHAAWELSGYALRQFDPHEGFGKASQEMRSAPVMSQDEAKAVFDSVLTAGDPTEGMKAVDWKKFFQAVMVILSLFANQS